MKKSLSRNSGSTPLLILLAFVVWLLMMVALSVIPLSFKLKLHTTGHYHDFGHYFVFLITAVMACQLARRFAGRLFVFFVVLAVALIQEWLENHMYHAGYEWKDVVTDLAGIVTGFALVTLAEVLFGASARSESR